MKHCREPLKEVNRFLRVCLALGYLDDIVKNGGNVVQSCHPLGSKNVKEGRECNHHSLVMLFKLLAACLESFDVAFLSRDNLNKLEHLLSDHIQRSIHRERMSQGIMLHLG